MSETDITLKITELEPTKRYYPSWFDEEMREDKDGDGAAYVREEDHDKALASNKKMVLMVVELLLDNERLRRAAGQPREQRAKELHEFFNKIDKQTAV